MAGDRELQEAVARFVRAFGLHQPDQTPCGQPVPVSEAHALGELARDGALRQSELAHRLRLEKSTTSRLVTQLINRGWADRTPAPDDGRGVLVQLTPHGCKPQPGWPRPEPSASPPFWTVSPRANAPACCAP